TRRPPGTRTVLSPPTTPLATRLPPPGRTRTLALHGTSCRAPSGLGGFFPQIPGRRPRQTRPCPGLACVGPLARKFAASAKVHDTLQATEVNVWPFLDEGAAAPVERVAPRALLPAASKASNTHPR